MSASRKLIKARIASVKNTRKITKAMELVAASKMRKAIAATVKGRPYIQYAKETIEMAIGGGLETEGQQSAELTHQLLREGKGEKVLMIVFTSDRGLAGGFNVNLVKFARKRIQELEQKKVDVIAVGKKGSDALQRLQEHVIATFTNLGNAPEFRDVIPVATMAIEGFTNGTYARVELLYTHYVSGVTQTPTGQTVLPYGKGEHRKTNGGSLDRYTIEPSPNAVLSKMIPRFVMTTFYQALLESNASEHAARMIAMKNASDAAADMMESLTFTYNQVRQAAITQEIAEISSGKAALE